MLFDLRDLNDALARSPIAGRYWIFGGLLLGWAREGNVLLHDSDDADFAYHAGDAERLERSFEQLSDAGFKPSRRFPGIGEEATEFSFTRGGRQFDFFRMDSAGERLRYRSYGFLPEHGQIVNVVEVPGEPLEEFFFNGRWWLKPRDHEAVLESNYGDWRTPRPGWNYNLQPNIVERQPWDGASNMLA